MRIHLIPLLLLPLAAPAAAQERNDSRPEVLKRVLDCRAITNAEERLTCFDNSVAGLAGAEQSGELVVVDGNQVKRTRRSLFGLSLPDLSIFGEDSDDEEWKSIESTVRAVGTDPKGRYVFVLEDGAVWRQVDSRDLPMEPRPGHPIKIRRAAMGSYLANVNGRVAIRVRRDR